MSTFNPETFMSQSFTEANDTVVTPCPVGEYVGVTGEPKFNEITSNKTGESYLQLVIPVTIDDPAVTEVTGRTPTVVRAQLFIDRNASGGIDFGKGKNVQLGRLREATGNNKPGVPFKIADLGGKLIKARVKHRAGEGEVIYDEVSGFAPAN